MSYVDLFQVVCRASALSSRKISRTDRMTALGTSAPFVIVLANGRCGRAEKIITEEIVGPVVCAQPFDDDLDRLAEAANDTTFGLAAGARTRNGNTVHKLAQRVRSGTVWINRRNVFDASLPFGGYKQSGLGPGDEGRGVPQLCRDQGGHRRPCRLGRRGSGRRRSARYSRLDIT